MCTQKKGICYVVGAGDFPEPPAPLVLREGDCLICADGGYLYAERYFHRKADFVLGDFDSLGFIPQTSNKLVAPAEKDETDMALALNKGLSLGYKVFHIYGGLGGERPDHSIGNIQLLHYLCEKGAKGFLFHGSKIFTAIKDSSITFSENSKGYLSVFSLSDKSEGVNLKGLKYELENYTLTNSNVLAISNEFIGVKAAVQVKNGVLLLAWSV